MEKACYTLICYIYSLVVGLLHARLAIGTLPLGPANPRTSQERVTLEHPHLAN